MLRQRPRITLHFAQSLDGRIALANTRTPLSSSAGIALAHRARADHDAVLVGSGTVKVDDPRLTVNGSDRGPRRIVLASTLDVPANARVLNGGPPTLVIGVDGRASPEALCRVKDTGAEVRLVSADPQGRASLLEALAAIREWGVERLLVEGGAAILSSFLRGRLADEVTIEIVPRFLGAPALTAVGALGVTTLDGAVVINEPRVERAEESIIVRGRLAH